MRKHIPQYGKEPSRMWRRACGILMLAVAGSGAMPGIALGQGLASEEEVDRSATFIERSVEATDLLNTGKVEEALTVYKDLAACCSDLDEDGFVAMGLGDCLAALGRREEARLAYAPLPDRFPELAENVEQRLIELDLAGPISDALLNRLRDAVATGGSLAAFNNFHLGRALQKQARTLLDEASTAFHSAAEENSSLPCATLMVDHIATLRDMAEQLGTAIETFEERWGNRQRYSNKAALSKSAKRDADRPPRKWEGQLRLAFDDGSRESYRFVGGSEDAPAIVTVNGSPVALSADQLKLLREHQEQIITILTEATRAMNTKEEARP